MTESRESSEKLINEAGVILQGCVTPKQLEFINGFIAGVKMAGREGKANQKPEGEKK